MRGIGVVASDIVSRILADLCGRNGLGDEYDRIDDEVRREIRAEWEKIVKEAVEK